MKKELPRILIAGTNSGCGKTTFVSGLLTALKRREKDLRAFKCGPDYIDPMFHASALGVPCRNLDLQFFDENTLRFSLAKNGGSLSVIEGVMGYYDGVGMTTRASSYAVAMASDTPAVLVVDARGAAHSVLAVIGGFLNLHPKSHIRGVILNRCSAMLYPRMKQAIADQFGGAVLPLGYLPVMKDCTLESRHLGLITAQEMTDLQEKLEALADQIEKSVDIPALCALAASAPELSWEPVALPEEGPPLRIAVARDNAFCFYYEDNLDLLRSLGAELVPFSPIADAALPENIRGLYLGGGYPELYAESLSENQSMKDSIRQALEAGLPCIAECGGFLYLQKELEGRPMVGFLPGMGHNTGKLSRFGYVTLTAQKDNLLCAAGNSSLPMNSTITIPPATGKTSWPKRPTEEPGAAALPQKISMRASPIFISMHTPRWPQDFWRCAEKAPLKGRRGSDGSPARASGWVSLRGPLSCPAKKGGKNAA